MCDVRCSGKLRDRMVHRGWRRIALERSAVDNEPKSVLKSSEFMVFLGLLEVCGLAWYAMGRVG